MRWLAGAAVGAGAGGNANRNAVEANGANGNGRPAVVADEQQNRNRGFVLGPFQAFGLGLALIVILTVIDIVRCILQFTSLNQQPAVLCGADLIYYAF